MIIWKGFWGFDSNCEHNGDYGVEIVIAPTVDDARKEVRRAASLRILKTESAWRDVDVSTIVRIGVAD